MTNRITNLNSTLSVTGVSGAISVRTEKDVYLDSEGIKAITDIISSGITIPDAELNLKVVHAMKTSMIRGVVVDAEKGVPLQGSKISIGDKETYTTSHGEYALLNISPGLHTINITFPGFDKVSSNINVLEGSQTFDASLYQSRYGTLESIITDSMTGEVIIGAKIELIPKDVLSSDSESRISYSNFNGISEINLPIGTYSLQITKENYRSFNTDILITGGLNQNQFPLTKTDIQPPTAGEITGRVINNVTGEILLGVEVKIENTFSSRVQMNEQSYHFYDISLGTHTLTVNHAGYDRFKTTKDIIPGQQSYDIFLIPSLYGSLTGTVKNELTGSAIVGAKIELTPIQVVSSDQSSVILYSDFMGSYTLNKIPVGTYAIKVTKQYYSDLYTTVIIKEGISTLDVNLQLIEQILSATEIEPNNNISQSTPLDIEEDCSGKIYPTADYDYYKVNIPSNGTIKVTVSEIPTGQTYMLHLFNSAGSVLANTSYIVSPGPATLSKFVESSGDYYVSVKTHTRGVLPHLI